MSNNNSPIRTLVVEDHYSTRLGLVTLLKRYPDVEIIGDTEFGEEAIRIVQDQVPDVMLLDLFLDTSQVQGLQVLEQTIAYSPSTQVIVYSAYFDDGLVFPALRAGALGYLIKNTLPQKIVEAIRDVAMGRHHFSPEIVRKLVENVPSDLNDQDHDGKSFLTAREREILPLLAKGLTNQEIADRLVIAHGTVKTHVSNILSKLHVSDRHQVSLQLAQRGARRSI